MWKECKNESCRQGRNSFELLREFWEKKKIFKLTELLQLVPATLTKFTESIAPAVVEGQAR